LSAAPRAGGSTPDAFGLLVQATVVFVAAVLVFGFGWALWPAVRAQNEAACRALAPEPRSGPAPEIELRDLEGRAVSLADYRGRFVVLNFWATWCEPCLSEWPQLAKLAERLVGRDDVVVLAVSIDDKPDPIPGFLARMELSSSPVQVLWAPGAAAHKAFGSEKIPDTYFVDERGELRAVFVNVRRWGEPAGAHCVDASVGRRSGR
jgi:thiol-disulfide isomerase/thioredoxin